MKESNQGFEAIRWNGHGEERTRDLIVTEEPLQVLINGKPYAVTMRTPGRDEAFIRGLLFSEDIIPISPPFVVPFIVELIYKICTA